MCGLAGVYSIRRSLTDNFRQVLERAGEAIQHRGPDDSGIWLDTSLGVGLVHRRLSIQDLSPLGAQPMTSHSERFVMVYNGEIYNFRSLRDSLKSKGYSFRGNSDTEVILAIFEEFGVEKGLQQLNGMFAIALIDRELNQLILCRDRMGEKPMYYGWHNDHFVFASELKALRALPFWSDEINRDSLTLLLRHNFIPAPHSIYRDIYKLPPASFISINLTTTKQTALPEPSTWWSMADCFNTEERMPDTATATTDRLDELLREVISEQMIADVPLGAFLSGGIDSSLVVAIMQQVSAKPIKTFTIGFNEQRYNEAEHAKAVARHLGTEHTEHYVTPTDALEVIPKLSSMYDEPFADSSQIPTHLVAKMTQQHVTVALSGDGGDELFCGYGRYFETINSWSNKCSDHTVSRQVLNSLSSRSESLIPGLIRWAIPSQRHLSVAEVSEKLTRKRLLSNEKLFNQYYRRSISYWQQPEHLLISAQEPDYSMCHQPPEIIVDNIYKHMMWQDLNCYLPDDILAKVDRAAMACSLETRIPLLDKRIVEFALGLPIKENVTKAQGKQVLKNLLYRYVPRQLVEREKSGFSVPVGNWLRCELRDWAEELLSVTNLSSGAIWNPAPIRRKWADHLAGRGDHSYHLWGVLMFQAWREQNLT